MKKLLPVFMFLLIYAPKIAGKIDLISLVCLFIFAFALRRGMIKNLQKSIVRPTINYLIFGAIMLVYVTFLVGLNGLNDLYQILRFGRIIVNILGLFGLVAIYNLHRKSVCRLHGLAGFTITSHSIGWAPCLIS